MSPTAESAVAVTSEVPLNNKSRRFNPALVGSVLVSGLFWNVIVAHDAIPAFDGAEAQRNAAARASG
jgi:hypothetical protein